MRFRSSPLKFLRYPSRVAFLFTLKGWSMSSLAQKMLLLLGNAGIRFLARHEFDVDDAAPMATPYDGLTIVDIETDKLSVSGGAMQIAAQDTPVWGDEGFYSNTSYTRTNGLAAFFAVNWTSTVTDIIGWMDSQLISTVPFQRLATFVTGTQLQALVSGAVDSPDLYTLATSTDYVIAIILRVSGMFIYLHDGPEWVLLWVDGINTESTLYIGTTNYNSTYALDYARVAQLTPAPLEPLIYIALPIASQTGNAPNKDFYRLSTLTTKPSAGTMEWDFRIQGASDYWQRQINSSGDLILNEVIAGTPFARGSSLAAVAGGEVESIIAYDEDIDIVIGSSIEIAYSSAANYKTETAFEFSSFGTSGVESDVEIWERFPTGGLLDELNEGKA